MDHRHDNEKIQFKKLFQQQGLDQFNKRFKVLDLFLKTDEHIDSLNLTKQLEQEAESFDENFVAGTMELLCKYGFASKIEFDNGISRFEHRHLGLHHDHMICTKCDKIIEFRDEELENNQSKMAAAYGFHMLQHKMEIYGICADCLKQRNLIISLNQAKQGEKIVVVNFEDGQVSQRLSSMGIKKGAIIEIISTQTGGQIVAAVEESRFVIGREMSTKVMVQPIDKTDTEIFLKNKIKHTSLSITTLNNVKQGQECIISKVSGEPKLRRRLLEMGINRGTKVYIEKYAPLRDPIELVVKGSHITLRVEEASHINVEDVKDALNND